MLSMSLSPPLAIANQLAAQSLGSNGAAALGMLAANIATLEVCPVLARAQLKQHAPPPPPAILP